LTQKAFEEVAKDFKTRIGFEYTRIQLKNKWDKLKNDYTIFKKLKLKETGGGWDSTRNTIKQDDEWWKKAKKGSSDNFFCYFSYHQSKCFICSADNSCIFVVFQDIPGCGKFQKHGLQNEEHMVLMFEDITSDGTDHWNPALGSIPQPSMPESSSTNSVFNVDDIVDVDQVETQTEENQKGKRLGMHVDGKNKKTKTTDVMQQQITKIGKIAEGTQSSFESYMKKEETSSVSLVMDLVVECGVRVGNDEYFIATELVVKREHRERCLYT
jgi:hypothetical protein